jgi:hypothetical protein
MRQLAAARRRHVSCEVAIAAAHQRGSLSAADHGRGGGALASAVDAFLSQLDVALSTPVKYRQTLAVVEGRVR